MSNGCTSVGKYDPATGHMSFELALDAMKRGKKVARKGYEGSWWQFINRELTFTTYEGDSTHHTRIYTEDLLAEDWYEVV